ncbi:hypothetical protein MMC25_001837 [Agyrium rufum]|nr:hypothetical protein [Agyrium rufum]
MAESGTKSHSNATGTRPRSAGNSAALSTSRHSLSPVRNRGIGRSATFGDITSSFSQRRSSTISETLDDARQSIRSSTDDLLLPKVTPAGLEAHHDQHSHWQSVPLVLALLPSVGGMIFTNGSAVITDVTLLVIAAIFLNWSVRLPWEWYISSQSILVQSDKSQSLETAYINPSIPEEIEEEDENEDGESTAIQSRGASPSRPELQEGRGDTEISAAERSATSELRVHELLALLLCFLGPMLGAYLLHTIRSQLSRPSEGLVSDYNLSIFLLGSLVRPLSHSIKMVQTRTLHLQRIVATSNPHLPTPTTSVDSTQHREMLQRLEDLESHILSRKPAAGFGSSQQAASSSNGGSPAAEQYPENPQVLLQAIRKQLQPDLDGLNRAVRRYEKRTTLLTLQTESRLQHLESRLADAITLAAAAERNVADNSRRGGGSAKVLLDWLCAFIVVPVKATVWLIGVPLVFAKWLGDTASSTVLEQIYWVEGLIGYRSPSKVKGKQKEKIGSKAGTRFPGGVSERDKSVSGPGGSMVGGDRIRRLKRVA